ncbi:hypothetical protein KCP73_10355 [Salmonella enterica subsp. enterica]|nr:hypothetical protein KCP73_10355 [Salmonella enterica subsp. enterica]
MRGETRQLPQNQHCGETTTAAFYTADKDWNGQMSIPRRSAHPSSFSALSTSPFATASLY